MPNYDIGIPLLVDAPLTSDGFAHLAGAVSSIANAAHQQWLKYAQGEPLPNGQVIGTRSGTYHRSIQIEQVDEFAWRIYTNLAYADAIERGMPARDLKKMLDSSLKVRRSKDGKRYLIVPFRWGTPGTVGFGRNVMSEAAHKFFQGQKSSRVISIGSRISGTGASDIKTRSPLLVPQARYEWGARLTAKHLGSANKRMAGMVNMRNPGGKGGAAHSQYLTFRVMSEDSPGWKAPAVPGKYPAKTVAEQFRPIAEKAFEEAVRWDLRQALGG